ncbi:AAA family ATPase [Streptomyces sp. NPDC001941]|uniref:AAA family ATPase n=1 Tax=Streptomyces sp. NPDC001941 TaxID=3154659 RepID=UPI0033189E66
MTWKPYYRGDGTSRAGTQIGPPPPWRTFPRKSLHTEFHPPAGLVEAVNAALAISRPLLLTGAPGSGKSTVIEQVTAELGLGDVLRWHITSRSTLADALYRYDALGRIHAQRLGDIDGTDDIAPFIRFGPLGTALLPENRPRALLIDEIDKSDLDLPSDLLDVLERGEFEIPELARYKSESVNVREWARDVQHPIAKGKVQCRSFPFIVMTSNGERDFPAPFLRRCVRYTMPKPTIESLTRVVRAHLSIEDAQQGKINNLVKEFIDRVDAGQALAVDQLLNAAHILTTSHASSEEDTEKVTSLLLRELSGA